jgi:hypothetical protein
MSLDTIVVRETIQNAVLTHPTLVEGLIPLFSSTAKNGCAWRRHYAF